MMARAALVPAQPALAPVHKQATFYKIYLLYLYLYLGQTQTEAVAALDKAMAEATDAVPEIVFEVGQAHEEIEAQSKDPDAAESRRFAALPRLTFRHLIEIRSHIGRHSRTLDELEVRDRTGAVILTVRDDASIFHTDDLGGRPFATGDVIVAIGPDRCLDALANLVTD